VRHYSIEWGQNEPLYICVWEVKVLGGFSK
jgi:hypothetical protein